MLHRNETEGLIVISQPSHAWVSGQLARHWGGGDFERPAEEVCLAAEQHDIGFLGWEQSPTLNPARGLPYSFLEMPTAVHLEIWTRGIQQLLRFGRYPALLVSRHYAGLARRHQAKGSPEEQGLRKEFLKQQAELQAALTQSLKADPYYAARLTEEVIGRDATLVSLWDWMSLLLCHPFLQETSIPEVPTGKGTLALRMTPLEPEGRRVRVQPWPFLCGQLRLVCEGRRLRQTFQEEGAMREALRRTEPETLCFDLVS